MRVKQRLFAWVMLFAAVVFFAGGTPAVSAAGSEIVLSGLAYTEFSGTVNADHIALNGPDGSVVYEVEADAGNYILTLETASGMAERTKIKAYVNDELGAEGFCSVGGWTDRHQDETGVVSLRSGKNRLRLDSVVKDTSIALFSLHLTPTGREPDRSETVKLEAEHYSEARAGANTLEEKVKILQDGSRTVVSFNQWAWMKYKVNIEAAGVYAVKLNAAADLPAAAELGVRLDDDEFDLVEGSFAPTGGWGAYQERQLGMLYLSKGAHTLRISISRHGVSADYFQLERLADSSGFQVKRPPVFLDSSGGRVALGTSGEAVSASVTVENTSAAVQHPVLFAAAYLDGRLIAVEQKTADLNPGESGTLLAGPIVPEGGSGQIKAMLFDSASAIRPLCGYGDLRWSGGENPVCQEIFVAPDGDDMGFGSREQPFRTIARAKAELLNKIPDMDGDLVVTLLPGQYELSKTEEFDERFSGRNGYDVVIRGAKGAEPPIVSGGRRISGWRNDGEGVWSAPAAGLDEVRGFYAGGYPAQRARSGRRFFAYQPTGVEGGVLRGNFVPYHVPGSQYEDDGFVIPASNFTEVAHPEELELVWNIEWTCQRTPVERIEKSGDMLNFVMRQPCYNNVRTKKNMITSPGQFYVGDWFYAENAREFLDEPGEFYFDRREERIYYIPFAEEDLQKVETYAAVTEFLVVVKGGTAENRVANLRFENLDFRYGAWNTASSRGVTTDQADKMLAGSHETELEGGELLPAQFQIENAENITVRDCRFSCLGSGAISMETGVSDTRIEGNLIRDISGTGVVVGSWKHNQERPGNELCRNILVRNNVIRRASQEFRGGTGISVYYANGVSVTHNLVQEVPYTGISVGWGWENPVRSCGNIHIDYNRIEDVTYATADGASIYSLGELRNSGIKGNYLKRSGDDRGGIYPDAGSAYLTIEQNVTEQMRQKWLNIWTRTIHDIKVSGNFVENDIKDVSGTDITVTGTVVKSGTWPQEAQDIIEQAGPEEPYRALMTGLELPQWRENFSKTVPNGKP